MDPAIHGGGPVKKVLIVLAVLSLGVAALAFMRSRQATES
jgi:hypothetical protein